MREYVASNINGVEGKELEFVPRFNYKTGIRFGYKNIASNVQYTFMSDQYTDATNSINGDLSGVIGRIPKYHILDCSLFYLINNSINVELGVNNAMNTHYFTTRATGYPGPGIIPSPLRNYYLTLEYKF